MTLVSRAAALTGRAEARQIEVFSGRHGGRKQGLSLTLSGPTIGGDGGDNNMVGPSRLALVWLGARAGWQYRHTPPALFRHSSLRPKGTGDGTQVCRRRLISPEKISLRYGVGVFGAC